MGGLTQSSERNQRGDLRLVSIILRPCETHSSTHSFRLQNSNRKYRQMRGSPQGRQRSARNTSLPSGYGSLIEVFVRMCDNNCEALE